MTRRRPEMDSWKMVLAEGVFFDMGAFMSDDGDGRPEIVFVAIGR
jgi:hypothetical protein